MSSVGQAPRPAPTFDPSGPAACDGIFGLPTALDDATVILVPVPWEATASYGRGTRGAPAAIRRASWQVELHDLETGEPYEAGIAMLDADPAIEERGVAASGAALRVLGPVPGSEPDQAELARLRAEVDAASRWLNGWVSETVSRWIERGRLVGLVGGDHSVALGAIAAHAAAYPGLGVLHLDAHADLRVAYEGFTYSHASVMERVLAEVSGVRKLVSVGLRDLCSEEQALIERLADRVTAFYDVALASRLLDAEPFARIAQQIVDELPNDVYVSFDIDALDPSLCPHTGTPVPGGLGFHQATRLLRAVATSGRRIVGFDLCEVGPGPAGDEWDANVGARVLYQLIGWALRSRARPRP